MAAEVQKLAERSLTAVQEIAELISKSTGQIDVSHSLSQSVADNLGDIMDNTGRTEESVNAIIDASKQQRADASKSTQLVEDLILEVDKAR